ncbi:DNA-directed DNA polymerase alpha catalytic subunit pol1 [Rhodotorula toruloides]
MEALRKARESGKRDCQLKEQEAVYDEVEEDVYRSVARGRFTEDDFNEEDDGVSRYADDGMDDWDRSASERDDDDDHENERPQSQLSRSTNHFAPSSDVASDPASDPFLIGAPSSDGFDGVEKTRFDSAMDEFDNDLCGMGRQFFDNFPSVEPLEELSKSNEQVKMEEDDDDLFVEPTAAAAKPKGPAQRRQIVNASAIKPVKPKAEPVDNASPSQMAEDMKSKRKAASAPIVASAEATGDSTAFNEEHETAISSAAMRAPAHQTNALEADGSLQFWWFDYDEPAPGTVRLVGKVRVKNEQTRVAPIKDGKKVEKDVPKFVSATVVVKNIKRKLYVLPKTKAEYYGGEVDEDDSDDEDDELPFDDVEGDFLDDAKGKWNLRNVSSTQGYVKRRYAFGIMGVPRKKTNWLEVTCDFPAGKRNESDIPIDAAGEQYSHVFGSTATAFERFVVAHKIMGPCWLNISKPKANKGDAFSWTKFEAEVDEKDISPFSSSDATAPKDVPRLTVLSLSSRTVVHLKENKREIVCAAARVWHDVDIDDPTPVEHQGSSSKVFVRNLFTDFPTGFDQQVRQHQGSPTFALFKAERPLLIQLLDYISRNDPGVIVGHDFSQLDLDVLLNRLRELKIDNWSRVGRFRVKGDKWPQLRSGWNTGLLAGRLLLDLTSDGSKSLIDSTTRSLTEMCETHLGIAREDIDPEDTAKFFDNVHSTAAHLKHFVLQCEADTYVQMAVAAKVQALPLTRQLTNLAGNSWNHTLAGNRAERNEYILLHLFYKTGYIVPDKISSRKKKAQIDKAEKKKKKKTRDDNGEEEPKVEVKREKYKGGLVFEPEKGLWDRYVLVMDYNSLYPSIIQEFDIDFLTIDWSHEGQYDITQKALKLTANSMYGCLGYEGSRFYARPLAALTTFKGREILTRTKADAEGMSLNVIYGDTDSVMINTNQTDYATALKIGEDFKKVINDKYKKLENDRDAVFERMLLLNKKKYAARKVEDDGKGGPGEVTTEIKGFDMKRREFSKLSKDASKRARHDPLAKATETVIEEIHEYLTDLGEKIRNGFNPLDDYIIHKRLGKNPEDYPDAKSLPHVQVALKMKAKGLSAKAGDVIPYIFCVPPNGETTKTAQAANAHHPDDVRRQGSTLKIDFEVYLSTQVLPPIERLCEHIEGTEKARLAECLGLDALRFESTSLDVPEREFKTLQSQISDAERFADAEPSRIRCRTCGTISPFDGILENKVSGMLSEHGFFCGNVECRDFIPTPSLAVQLDLKLCGVISKFYYADAKLYDQLLYIDTSSNIERALGKVAGGA